LHAAQFCAVSLVVEVVIECTKFAFSFYVMSLALCPILVFSAFGFVLAGIVNRCSSWTWLSVVHCRSPALLKTAYTALFLTWLCVCLMDSRLHCVYFGRS